MTVQVAEPDTSVQACLADLYEALCDGVPANVVAVEIFFNCQGWNIEYRTRTHEGLKRDGISMRNLKGEYIKGE